MLKIVSVTYVTLVPWRRERRRHVGWPTKLGSRQRDLSTSSVTKRANGHWHAIIASSCCWSPREYGDARVPQSGSTVEGGEGGGATRFVSGSERCLPQSCELLMHFREEWHQRGALRTSVTPTEKPLVQPQRIRTRWTFFFFFHTSPTFSAARESIAVISGSDPDNATTPEGGNVAGSSSPERELALRCSDRHLVVRGSTEGNGRCTPFCRGPSPLQR